MDLPSAARPLLSTGAILLGFGCSLTLDSYEFSQAGGAGVAGRVGVSPGGSGSGGSVAAVGAGSPTNGGVGEDSLGAVEGQRCVVDSARVEGCTLE